MTRKYFAAALVAASSLALDPAVARPPVIVTANTEIPTRQVSFADLNLASAAGQRTLEGRVRVAALDACADSGWTNGSRDESAGFRQCRSDSMNRARPAMTAAVQRARELASTGRSSIASAATISLSVQH
jgi:UrcA family protein